MVTSPINMVGLALWNKFYGTKKKPIEVSMGFFVNYLHLNT